MAFTLVMSGLTFWFARENGHFDFFPRRIAADAKHGEVLPLEHDLVMDERTWRFWVSHVKRDHLAFERPLTYKFRDQMLARIADNARWNQFVDFVRVYRWVQPFVLLGSVGICAILAWNWRKELGWVYPVGLAVAIMLSIWSLVNLMLALDVFSQTWGLDW